MKKTYIYPEMDVVKIETMSVLADSLKTDGKKTLDSEDQFLAPDYDDEDEEDW